MMDRSIEEHGIEVDRDLHEDLIVTMTEQQPHIFDQHPPGSFQRIFWEQQYSASQVKSSTAMKWEPSMIRFVKHNSTFSQDKHFVQVVSLSSTPFKLGI